MAFFTDRQFAVVVGLGCIGAWFLYRKSQAVATAAGDAVSDSAWWWGHKADQAAGAIDSFFTWDAFDRKHRHKQTLMNDTQYQNWKARVLAGQIPEPEYN